MSDGTTYIQAYFKGGMTGFEVIPTVNNEYQLARNGAIIATVRHDKTWQQLSGDKLPDDVLESIGLQIEKPESQA
jgi:hypothetical protein